jgi:hypothetical protein
VFESDKPESLIEPPESSKFDSSKRLKLLHSPNSNSSGALGGAAEIDLAEISQNQHVITPSGIKIVKSELIQIMIEQLNGIGLSYV